MRIFAEMYNEFKNIKKNKNKIIMTMNSDLGKLVNCDLKDKKPFYDYYKNSV